MADADDGDRAELTDEEKFGRTQYPPDRPLGVNDRGADDSRDSVAERRAREIPEREGSGRRHDVGHLMDQADESGVDDEADAVAHESRDDWGLGRDRSVQDLEEVEPAEEAAMHLVEDPPMGDGDGYLDGER